MAGEAIATYFMGIQQTCGSSQMPENSFVLGYGIFPNPPDEERQNAMALEPRALSYSSPKQLALTVTPGDEIS